MFNTQTHKYRLMPAKLTRTLASASLVLLYVAIDWATFISPMQHLNVTPWNPAPALGMLLIILNGPSSLLVMCLGIFLSEVFVRDIPTHLLTSLWLAIVLTTGYTLLANALKSRFPDGLFSDRIGLLKWSLIVMTGTLLVSLLFISQLLLTGLLDKADVFDAVIRYWIGDIVGIFVAMPFFFLFQDRSHLHSLGSMLLRWESALYLLLAVALLFIVFAPDPSAHSRYFYVLFLPLVWAASRQGMIGAILCATTLQFGVFIGGWMQEFSDVSLFELQLRSFLMALVGFTIGVVVEEQRRTTAELRQSLKLAAAGEMAAALAHELNQPLTALKAYGSAFEQLRQREGSNAQLSEVAKKMVGEALRAAGVVQRLRDFFRTGATQLAPVSVRDIVSTVSDTFLDRAREQNIDFKVDTGLNPVIVADRMQIEVVLRNLIENAFDAVANHDRQYASVSISVNLAGEYAVIDVQDNGPGISESIHQDLYEPFVSTKSNGLGLGLAISRAITEAHGGSLIALNASHGHFRLSLPAEMESRRTDE